MRPQTRSFLSAALTLPVGGVALALLLASTSAPAFAAQPPVGLGTATSYAVLAGTTVTNTGPSVISGDVGVNPGSAVVGFPPGTVNNGTIHAADAVSLQAQNDLTTAYNDAAGRGPVVDKTSQDLGGTTLVPGVYNAASAMALTGTVTLDAQGDPNAVFVFQAGSTLITASSSAVALIGGTQACNVFWQVGSSATLGTGTNFVGNVMALTSIDLQTGANLQGRALARNGAVTLDTNVITRPGCAAPSPSPSSTPTATPSPSASNTPTPTATHTPTSGPPTTAGPGGPGTPTIPTGHPGTGGGGDVASGTGTTWLLLGLLSLAGATGAAVLGWRNSTPRVRRQQS
jgi:hypothetical protein